MNYEIKDEHRLLSKEEINHRKAKLKMPQGPEPYDRDILDDIMEWEDGAIIRENEIG